MIVSLRPGRPPRGEAGRVGRGVGRVPVRAGRDLDDAERGREAAVGLLVRGRAELRLADKLESLAVKSFYA